MFLSREINIKLCQNYTKNLYIYRLDRTHRTRSTPEVLRFQPIPPLYTAYTPFNFSLTVPWRETFPSGPGGGGFLLSDKCTTTGDIYSLLKLGPNCVTWMSPNLFQNSCSARKKIQLIIFKIQKLKKKKCHVFLCSWQTNWKKKLCNSEMELGKNLAFVILKLVFLGTCEHWFNAVFILFNFYFYFIILWQWEGFNVQGHPIKMRILIVFDFEWEGYIDLRQKIIAIDWILICCVYKEKIIKNNFYI